MHTHYTKSLNPETLTRIVLARKIQLVPLIAICSGNKEQHQNNLLSLYYCVKWGLKKKKNTNQFGFLQNAGFFFLSALRWCQSELRGETNTSQNEWQERNKNSCQSISQCKNLLYTQCQLVFTWAWTYKIYRICLPQTQKINHVSYSVHHIQDKSPLERWRGRWISY